MFFFAPDAEAAEGGFYLRHVWGLSGGGAGAQGDEIGAGMFLAQAVLEAVLSVAGGAVDADGVEGVDVGFAGWGGALCSCKWRWFLAQGS